MLLKLPVAVGNHGDVALPVAVIEVYAALAVEVASGKVDTLKGVGIEGKGGSSRKLGAWILRKVLNLWHENRRCNMDVPP